MTIPILTYRPSGQNRLGVDLDRLMVSRALIQANSGGGKSRALRSLLEETFHKVQHVVIDPEGEFHTLREKYPYVLAAKTGGDVLASPKTAKLLCRKIMELGASTIIDIYEWSPDERREFVRIFLTEMTNLPKTLWRPCIVVIDEAHTFAPEGAESVSGKAVINFISLARKRGFCPILATQRISKLHKDAAAELNNRLIGRTGLDVDIKRAGDELGFDKEKRATLKHLEPGQFYVFGPAISREVVICRTGEVETSHPEPGHVSSAPIATPEKVKAMLAQLGDLPAEAEQEARTIDELRRANADLQRQLRHAEKEQAKTRTVVTDPNAIAGAVAKERERLTRDFGVSSARFNAMVRNRIERLRKHGAGALADLDAVLQELDKVAADGAHAKNDRLIDDAKRYAPVATTPVLTGQRPAAKVYTKGVVAPPTNLLISKGGQKILDALAEFEVIGVDVVTRHQLGMMAGYNLTGGSGAQHIADLGAEGYIELPDKGMVRLTEAGRANARTDAAPTSLDELHERVLAKLSAGQRKIAEHLLSIWPDSISRADLGEATGYNLTGGSGAQHVADLVTIGAATIPSSGKVRASDLFFPESLR